MSAVEAALCRSAPWRFVARRVVLPWALQGEALAGHVLEIGGGSGAMAAEVLASHPNVDLTMTDIDEEMVAAAQRRLAAHGRRASARAADASRLPFPDDSFDVVLSWIMLHHVGAWEQALGEALRVTRPGGRLIGYDLLSTRTLRGLHHSQAGSFRALTTRAMRDVIAELPVTQAILTPGLAGATIRFTLTKRGVDPAAA